MPKKLTAETVNDRLAPRGIRMTSEFKNVDTKAWFRCSEGHQWDAKPCSVLSSKAASGGCRTCAGKAPLTAEIVNARLAPRGIRMTSEFKTVDIAAWFECSKGHPWETAPGTVMSSTAESGGCRTCSGLAPHTAETVNERLAARGIRMTSEFKNVDTKAWFRCSEGHRQWAAKPASVLSSKAASGGCPVCAGNMRLTADEVNERLAPRGVHLIGGYKDAKTDAWFQCSKGHQWETAPNNVLYSKSESGGCPGCTVSGFDSTKPAILYYVRTGCGLYKIGVTNRTVEQRFRDDTVTVVAAWQYDDGAEARAEEQRVLRTFADQRYDGPAVLKTGGDSELFTADVLCFDDERTNPNTVFAEAAAKRAA